MKTWQLLLLALLPFLPAITIALAASLPILFIGVAAVAITGFAMTPMLVLAAVLFLAFFPAQRRWLLQLVQRVAASLHLLRPLPHGQHVKHTEKPRGEGWNLSSEQQPARSPTVEPVSLESVSPCEAGKPVENGSSVRAVVTSSPRLQSGHAVETSIPSVAVSYHPTVLPAEKAAGTGGGGAKMGEGMRVAGKAASSAGNGSPKTSVRVALSPSRGKAEIAGKGLSEGGSPAKSKEGNREAGNASKNLASVEQSVTGSAAERALQSGTPGSGNGNVTAGKKSGATKGQPKSQGKSKGKNKRG
ncbi:unnamed protein product [Closterium sp. NIES-64]|nr:unnamed protein product [Closterium sp. NIES-64]CAI6007081.1 unnamed protein product [Closterium sp. NIES-65]